MKKKQPIYLGAIALIAVAVGMYFHQQPLTNQEVVDMELCFSAGQLQQITEKFSPEVLIHTFSIHVIYDFFLMLAYVYFLSTWIRYVVTLNISDSWNQTGRWFSNGIYAAGVLDALEDFLMYRNIVLHQPFINWSYLSSIKFFLILLGILYLLVFLGKWVTHKKSA